MVLPPMSANGFPGKRVDANLAGIIPMNIFIGSAQPGIKMESKSMINNPKSTCYHYCVSLVFGQYFATDIYPLLEGLQIESPFI